MNCDILKNTIKGTVTIITGNEKINTNQDFSTLEKYANKIKTKLQSNIYLKKNISINCNLEIYNVDSNIKNKKHYTGTSNFDKFLQFLYYYNLIKLNNNNNIYVVSHSHAMQHFVKDNYSEYNKKDDIFKQNLWSIKLNNKIIITRHAFSVANIAKEKMIGFMSLNQITEKDSGLSMYGVVTALFHEIPDINTLTDPTVYVSPLIRTWMTAVCLYLKNRCKTFDIVISPYIIEDGGVYDNTPNPFHIQVDIFLKFLNTLYKIINFFKIDNFNNISKINVYDGRTDSMCIFTNTKNNKNNKNICNDYFSMSPIKNEPFFKEQNSNNKTNKNPIKISEMQLLYGVNKPSKSYLNSNITRWCEPFAMESSLNKLKSLGKSKESMCKSRLNKTKTQYSVRKLLSLFKKK